MRERQGSLRRVREGMRASRVSAVLVGTVFVLLGFPRPSWGTVADFEGLADGTVPDGYQGFTWGGMNAFSPSPGGCGATSIPAIRTLSPPPPSTSVTITRQSGTFDFNGALFAAGCKNGQNMRFEGLLAGDVIFDQSLSVDMSPASFLELNYSGIDSLRITPSGGMSTGCCSMVTDQFFMDNFTFDEPIGPTETPTTTPTEVATATPTETPTPTIPPPASCAATPLACDDPGKSLFLLKKKTGDPTKTKLIWKWLVGTVAGQSAFGDPTTATSYALCVYDDGDLVEDYLIASSGTCNGSPCWKAISDKGYKYKHSSGNADGITKVLLKSGTGNAKLLVKGKGGNVAAPVTNPLFTQATNLTVQLVQSGVGSCWQAVYPTPAVKNTDELFKDKIP